MSEDLNENKKSSIKSVLIFAGLAIAVIVGLIISTQVVNKNGNSNETPRKDKSEYALTIKTVETDGGFGDSEVKTYISEGKVYYTSAGSSSCPPIVDKAVYNPKLNEISLTVKTYGKVACTMDLRPFKQEISFTDGSNIKSDTKINIGGGSLRGSDSK